MDKQKYLEKYFKDLRDIINFDSEKIKNLVAVSDTLLKTNSLGKKNNNIWQWWKRSNRKSF